MKRRIEVPESTGVLLRVSMDGQRVEVVDTPGDDDEGVVGVAKNSAHLAEASVDWVESVASKMGGAFANALRTLNRDISNTAASISPPPLGETLVSLFTPSKYRESVLVEMQEAYERTSARHGRWVASAAYWIEIGRNTIAFMGWKVPAAIGGLITAGVTLFRTLA